MKLELSIAFALCAMLHGSCMQAAYTVRYEDNPVSTGVLVRLRPGEDDLESCLTSLGAPHHVFEYNYDGMALLWHHVDSAAWAVTVSMNVARNAPGARFSMDSDSATMPGAMLWFDRDCRLIKWRQGLMRDLKPGFRPRPADLEQQDRDDR